MKKILLIVVIGAYNICLAQVQLTDLHTSLSASRPWKFFTFNDALYFIANSGESGDELYRSDGTASGTALLKDINVGLGSCLLSHKMVFNNKLYFVAHDGASGYQLWTTDGSTAGTRAVTDNLYGNVNGLAHDGESVYFVKSLSSGQIEVWKTDGTKNGTVMVKGGIPSPEGAENVTSALGLVFFTIVQPDTQQTFLWRSDGTEAGTFVVSSSLGGHNIQRVSHPRQFIEYGGALYFAATKVLANGSTVALMKTDGTVEGTKVVSAMYDGPLWTEFHDVIVHSNKMYFLFFEKDTKRLAIWQSEGLPENTIKIYDYTGPGYFVPSVLCGAGDNLFFTSGNAANGTSLIKFNILTYQHEPVKELIPAMQPPSFFFSDMDMNLIQAAGPEKIFIRSNTDLSKPADLWVSDGSEAGTTRLSKIAYLYPNMAVFNGQLFYSGAQESEYELWKSDGTVSGTGLLKEINDHAPGMTYWSLPFAVEKGVAFSATDAEHGTEFWASDGTPAGTSVVDIRSGTQGSFPRILATDKKAFFPAIVEHPTCQIFWSDGTVSGTQMLTNFPQGSSMVPQLKSDNRERFFVAVGNPDGTRSLHTLSMTSGELNEIKNLGLTPSGFSYSIDWMSVANGILYFTLRGNSEELWKSDGTTAGTVKVTDVYGPQHLYGVGEFLYFTQYNQTHTERGLYKSDGTAAGTTLLKKIDGTGYGDVNNFFVFQDKLLFTVMQPSTGRELWVSDGTTENTGMLKDIHEGPADGMVARGFAEFQNAVYFTAFSPAHGSELWKTDGTAAGTVLVKDIVPGPDSSTPMYLAATSNGLYFAAYTPEHGYEIWNSDGTTQGTKLELDFAPGPAYSNPRGFVYTGTDLVFIAGTSATGAQLWTYREPVTSVMEEGREVISVYPNPSSGIYTIESDKLSGGTLTVFNAQGSRVSVLSDLASKSHISLTHLPSGLYVLRFSKGLEVVTLKVVKL